MARGGTEQSRCMGPLSGHETLTPSPQRLFPYLENRADKCNILTQTRSCLFQSSGSPQEFPCDSVIHEDSQKSAEPFHSATNYGNNKRRRTPISHGKTRRVVERPGPELTTAPSSCSLHGRVTRHIEHCSPEPQRSGSPRHQSRPVRT